MTEDVQISHSITKSEINDLPLIAWDGTVKILVDIEQMQEAVEILKGELILGFDTETRPSFRKGEYYPPALIQIANEDCVYLFRICKTSTFESLLPILENEKIIKAGVGISDDVKQLNKLAEFSANGFIEISEITDKIGYKNRGLRALTGLLIGGRISKASQVTNWAKPQLDSKQVRYAATDAWVSREIYLRAVSKLHSINGTNPDTCIR